MQISIINLFKIFKKCQNYIFEEQKYNVIKVHLKNFIKSTNYN